jgi:acyl-CoA synthetase (AMP-forming)/AMP-acid ligase II
MRADETVFLRFQATAIRWPQRDFLVTMESVAAAYNISAGALTYGAVLAEVERRAAQLKQAGYGYGHRVGLLLENRPDFVLWFLACNALGLSIVPINPDLRAAELEYMIGHSEMALAIAIAARANDLASAAKAIGVSLNLALPNEQPPNVARAPTVLEAQDGADREAAVLYTSGTTGSPKGCILANEYFLAEGDWYRDVGGIAQLRDDGERMLTPLPVFHMNALACSLMAMITVGGALILLDRFHPKSWWRDVRDSGATIVHYLGVMPSMLMGAPETPEDRAHKVRFGFGAGIDRALHDAFEKRFGFQLVEAWAMTETGAGAVIAATDPHQRKTGRNCFGRAPEWLDVRIETEDGRNADVDEPGELLVRRKGDNPRFGFFRRYLKDDIATNDAWAGGWFHTGDIVKKDKDGDFQFVDRKKNVIRRSGENIAAVEVESALAKHPAIKQVGVAAVADDVRGDEVAALIVLRAGQASQTLAIEIADWCREQLAYYKSPGWIAFVDKLPLTSTEKIQRAQLKASAASLVSSNAAFDLRARKKRNT